MAFADGMGKAMQGQGLEKNATLRDVSRTLDDAEEFVRRVSGVMWEAHKAHGDIVMRLGITGAGRRPNYRLETASNGQPFEAIDGNNHEPWPPGFDYGAPANWSTATMTLDDVRSLLGELRAIR